MKQTINHGPGGREVYLDEGDYRVVVRQLVTSDYYLEAPTILGYGIDGSIAEVAPIIDAFIAALGVARQWDMQTGDRWTPPDE